MAKKWYLCDPMKNMSCKKKSCVHRPDAEVWACFSTLNEQAAVLDERGKPIEVTDLNQLALPVFRSSQRPLLTCDQTDLPCK